jgi:hypothetical protein
MPRDSQFWAGLMKVKDEFLSMDRFDLGDGSQLRFWEDSWITPHPLNTIFSTLYNIVRKKSASIISVLSTKPLNIAFSRSMMGVNLQAWYNVVSMIADVHLNNQRDSFVWWLHQNGLFSVHYMYRALLNVQAISYDTLIWKLKLPLKVKVFMWYLYERVVLTKYNLIRRQWQGDKKCCFCSSNETIQHLLFDCHYAKFMWRFIHISFNLRPSTSIHNMFIG